MTAVDHEAVVAKLLADLGPNADAVADRLRALEIKGRTVSAHHCPIATYLSRTETDVTVGLSEAFTKHARTRLTAPVAEFIERFDRGVYLDLVEGA